MNRSIFRSFIVRLALVGSPFVILAQQQPVEKALVGGTLIDGYGGRPVRNSVILVRGDRIVKVGTVDSLPVPSGYQQVSTDGMTVLPGLWDSHVHLIYAGHPDLPHWFSAYASQFETVTMPAAAQQLLMAGVTSARDLGAPLEDAIKIKKRIASGEIPGPTMYVAGPFLLHQSIPIFTHAWAVSGASDAREKVRKLADAGVDIIKVITQEQMSKDEVAAIVSEAHTHHLKVAAHARTADEIRRGLEFGFDEFEHIGLRTAPEYPADIITSIRERTSGSALYWTPTVGPEVNYEYLRENPEILDDPAAFRGLPANMVEDVKNGLAHFDRDAAREDSPESRRALKRKFDQLRDAGVTLLVGSDGGIGGNSVSQATWLELDAWVNHLGVDPMTAIQKATYLPALVMGVEKDNGTVTEGKYADIIAVRGDPLRHIDVLRDPAIVIKRGHRYK